jgi:hypothetical protein
MVKNCKDCKYYYNWKLATNLSTHKCFECFPYDKHFEWRDDFKLRIKLERILDGRFSRSRDVSKM